MSSTKKPKKLTDAQKFIELARELTPSANKVPRFSKAGAGRRLSKPESNKLTN